MRRKAFSQALVCVVLLGLSGTASACADQSKSLAACVPRDTPVPLGCGHAEFVPVGAECDAERASCLWVWKATVTVSPGACAEAKLKRDDGPETGRVVVACCPGVNAGSTAVCHNVGLFKFPLEGWEYGDLVSFSATLDVFFLVVGSPFRADDSATWRQGACWGRASPPPLADDAARAARWALLQALPEGTLHENPDMPGETGDSGEARSS